MRTIEHPDNPGFQVIRLTRLSGAPQPKYRHIFLIASGYNTLIYTMPESETEALDYYPSGWSEEIHDEYYIEWRSDDDESILVRLDGTMGDGDYSVTPITGVNTDDEEFVTRPISRLSREEAFDVAATLIYAMNGVAGRLNGEDEFTGDITDEA